MTTRSQFVSALEELRESAVRLVKASEALLEIARGEKETTRPSEPEAEKKETRPEEPIEKRYPSLRSALCLPKSRGTASPRRSERSSSPTARTSSLRSIPPSTRRS